MLSLANEPCMLCRCPKFTVLYVPACSLPICYAEGFLSAAGL